jgi:Fur family ferric uptake transcriptional regulator
VSKAPAREKFKSHLATKGLRVTNQRLAIFEAAFAQTDHFTAEELLDHARAIDDSVSRATVYRTLPIMIESALLREVDIGKNLKYYLPNPDNNAQVAQVICLDCDKIFEINARFSGTTPFRAYAGFNEVDAIVRHAVYGDPITRLKLEPVIVLRYLNEMVVTARELHEMSKNSQQITGEIKGDSTAARADNGF